jgi:hypothetical protein
MSVMLVVMSAAPAMADKGGKPHQGSWGYGSFIKKQCKESGGTYHKFNVSDHGTHIKAQGGDCSSG